MRTPRILIAAFAAIGLVAGLAVDRSAAQGASPAGGAPGKPKLKVGPVKPPVVDVIDAGATPAPPPITPGPLVPAVVSSPPIAPLISGPRPSVAPSPVGLAPAGSRRRRSRRGGGSGGSGSSGTPRGLIPGRKQFQSAVDCAQCHDRIYDDWALSMHAKSHSDPLFKKALARATAMRGSRIREACYACHAPVAVLSNDYSFRKKVTREGVTCDVCHSITSVDTVYSTPLHYHTDPGIQRGPYRDSPAPHPVSYSHLMTQSLFCAACHQGNLNAEHDFMALDTYGEWERSSYNSAPSDVRTGYGRPEVATRCQDCHMKGYSGEVAKGGPHRTEAHGHLCAGSQNEGVVGSGLTFHTTARKSPDRRTLYVTVQTHNKLAGHALPSGFPDRRLVIDVTGIDREMAHLFHESRAYGRIFHDAKGNSPVPFWSATGVERDNRVNPGEIRTEHFTFALSGDLAELRVQLLYYHLGEDLQKAYRTKVEPMVIEERSQRFAR